MRTNPKIRELFVEISTRSIELSNSVDEQRKYLRRLINIYITDLNENERIFLLKQLLTEVSHKTQIDHPDTLKEIYSIRLRFVSQVATVMGVLVLLSGVVYRTNPHINSVIDSIGKTLKLFGLK